MGQTRRHTDGQNDAGDHNVFRVAVSNAECDNSGDDRCALSTIAAYTAQVQWLGLELTAAYSAESAFIKVNRVNSCNDIAINAADIDSPISTESPVYIRNSATTLHFPDAFISKPSAETRQRRSAKLLWIYVA